jgi:hypothetical protein
MEIRHSHVFPCTATRARGGGGEDGDQDINGGGGGDRRPHEGDGRVRSGAAVIADRLGDLYGHPASPLQPYIDVGIALGRSPALLSASVVKPYYRVAEAAQQHGHGRDERVRVQG